MPRQKKVKEEEVKEDEVTVTEVDVVDEVETSSLSLGAEDKRQIVIRLNQSNVLPRYLFEKLIKALG